MSFQIPKVSLPLDPTGSLPSNYIADEEHDLIGMTPRVVKFKFGASFVKSVTMIDTASGLPLTPYQDFVGVELLPKESRMYGSEICSMLLVKKSSVTSIKMNYQALGSRDGDVASIYPKIYARNSGNSFAVEYRDILNKPLKFNPSKHFHHLNDTYGWQEYYNGLEHIYNLLKLRNAFLVKDSVNILSSNYTKAVSNQQAIGVKISSLNSSSSYPVDFTLGTVKLAVQRPDMNWLPMYGQLELKNKYPSLVNHLGTNLYGSSAYDTSKYFRIPTYNLKCGSGMTAWIKAK